MLYTLKDGSIVESIPIGKSSVKIGEKSPDGYLTVIDRIAPPKNSSSRKAFVVCQCQCGQYISTNLNAIRTGHKKSCGCINHEIFVEKGKEVGNKVQLRLKDYTQVYNPFYIFNYRTDKKDSNGYYWDVICKKCGKHYNEIPSQLISDIRPKGNNPCVCWKKESKGILKIKRLLSENNISFIVEKTFDSCLSDKQNLLRFDFWVNDNYLIEYDGEQHFHPVQFHNKTEEEAFSAFILQQKYDNIKNNWCLNNHIPLIRIPYSHYNDLCINDLLPKESHFLITDNNTRLK